MVKPGAKMSKYYDSFNTWHDLFYEELRLYPYFGVVNPDDGYDYYQAGQTPREGANSFIKEHSI